MRWLTGKNKNHYQPKNKKKKHESELRASSSSQYRDTATTANNHQQSSIAKPTTHTTPNDIAQATKFHSGKLYPFTKDLTKIIPEESGHYEIIWKFPGHDELIYVGIAAKGKVGNLRHRVMSYAEKDDFKSNGNPSKQKLRDFMDSHQGQIYIKVFVEPIETAMISEAKLKKHTQFNQDNKINTDTFHYTP